MHLQGRGGLLAGICPPKFWSRVGGAKNDVCSAKLSAFEIHVDRMGHRSFSLEQEHLAKALEESAFAFSFGETLFIIITIT